MTKLTWRGWREDGKTYVLMSAGNHWCNVPFYLDEVNHASEFSWSYWGSGPAQLAYAILRTYFEIVYGFSPTEARFQAEKYHQEFKVEYVTAWRNDNWFLESFEIDSWLSGEKGVCS